MLKATSPLIRVLQRNRANQRYIERVREREEICRELAHMITDAEKAQDLQSAAGDPGEPMV